MGPDEQMELLMLLDLLVPDRLLMHLEGDMLLMEIAKANRQHRLGLLDPQNLGLGQY